MDWVFVQANRDLTLFHRHKTGKNLVFVDEKGSVKCSFCHEKVSEGILMQARLLGNVAVTKETRYRNGHSVGKIYFEEIYL